MCARYNLHSDPKLLVDQFGVEVGLPMPRFNIAPTQWQPTNPAARWRHSSGA
jgi:hypothetical protein